MDRYNRCERVWADMTRSASQPDAGCLTIVQVQIVNLVEFQATKVEVMMGVRRRSSRVVARGRVVGRDMVVGRREVVGGGKILVGRRRGGNDGQGEK